MSVESFNSLQESAKKLNESEAKGYMKRYLKATKKERLPPVSLLTDLLLNNTNHIEDGAFNYECLMEKLIKHFMVAEHMQSFSSTVDGQKEVAQQLEMLLWFFRSLHEDSTMATLHLYDIKTGCKETKVDSYHSQYKEKAEIAEAAAAIRAKYRNQ